MNDIVGDPSVADVGRRHAPAPDWLVQCDFDGTISTDDVTDSLLQRFGRDGWQQLEAAWERQEIGSRECMTRQVALLDMSPGELDAHLATLDLDPHFAAFVRAARARGLPVQVVSDGLERAISFLLKREGLDELPVMANRLVQAGPRSWRLESPWASARCIRASGNCKCERLAEQRDRHRRVLFIGDGSSDFCVSARADFVLAKHRLVDHCKEQRIPHAAFGDFSEVLAWLPHLCQPVVLTAGP